MGRTISVVETHDRARTAWFLPDGWARLAIAAVLLVGGIGIRAVLLDQRQMFKDEGASWLLASYDPPALIAHAMTDLHPPLYELLLHFWIGAFGDGLAAMRLLSVLLGSCVVLAAWRWGHEAVGPRWGLVVLAAVALSGMALENSREVRFHVLEVLFATLAWWLIWRTTRPGADGRPVLAAAFLAVAVAGQLWTSPMGVPTVALQGFVAVAIVAVRRDSRSAAVLAAIAVGCVAYLPWLPAQIDVVRSGPPFWATPPGPFLFPYALDTQLMGRGHTRVVPILAGLVLLVIAALGMLDLLLSRRTSPERRAHNRFLAWILLAALSLIPLVWIYSQIHSVWDVGYFGNTLAALGIALAAGCRAIARMSGSRRVVSGVIAAAVVTVLALSSVQRLGQRLSDEDLTPAREVHAALAQVAGPDDLVVAADARSYFALAWLVGRRSDPLPLAAPMYSWSPSGDVVAIGQGLVSPQATLDDAKVASAGGWNGLAPELANGGRVFLVDLENDELAFEPLARGDVIEVGRTEIEHAGRVAQVRELVVP
jgi:4-amino-4-deoxy-L-arabinose transferase-like glycosyltransferase